MGRPPCRDKVGLKRGTWTSEEDQKLVTFIQQNGHGSWRSLPAKAGLRRCGKSCRLRWNNYLRPDINRVNFSLTEERTIIQLHALLGNRWSAIACYLPKRTDNDIKNFWNTHLKKKLIKMGIDPVTHKPRLITALFPGQEKAAADLSHMAQWERVRLQAEARLTRSQSKLAPTTHAAPPATGFNAPASYRVENPLDDGLDELMKLVTSADVDKRGGFGHTVYSDNIACVANNDILWSGQNLIGVLTRNNVDSDEFTWNNLVGGDAASLTNYGEASGGFLPDVLDYHGFKVCI